jgi:hypothetical protein
MYSTSRPTSITSPVISWPRIRPFGAVVRPRTIDYPELVLKDVRSYTTALDFLSPPLG